MSLISCAQFGEVQLKMDQAWADSRVKADFEANAESAIALIQNTTAKLTDLTNPDKDKEVSIKWLNYCDAGTQNCTDDCEITPVAEASAHCESYAFNICFESKGFIIDETDLRDKIWEVPELLSILMLKEIKAMDEEWAVRSVTAIDAYKGVNVYTTGAGQVTGTTTTFSPAMWTPSIMGELVMTAKLNKFTNPFLLSGQNLYLANWNAMMDASNADGSGQAKRISAMKMYSDLYNVDQPGVRHTYMIQAGSIGFFTKARYAAFSLANMKDLAQFGSRFSVDSKTLPGVKYDVVRQLICDGDNIKHAFKLKTRGLIAENPLGCDPTNTGVLDLVCG